MKKTVPDTFFCPVGYALGLVSAGATGLSVAKVANVILRRVPRVTIQRIFVTAFDEIGRGALIGFFGAVASGVQEMAQRGNFLSEDEWKDRLIAGTLSGIVISPAFKGFSAGLQSGGRQARDEAGAAIRKILNSSRNRHLKTLEIHDRVTESIRIILADTLILTGEVIDASQATGILSMIESVISYASENS